MLTNCSTNTHTRRRACSALSGTKRKRSSNTTNPEHDMNINTPISPIPEPNHPPDSLNLEELTTLPISPSSSLTLLQLKAHRSEAVLHNVLHSQSYHVLMIQEPWVSKFTLLPAVHPAWHLITPMGHTPKTLDERMKTCIYISKTVPTKAFTSLPTESPLLHRHR